LWCRRETVRRVGPDTNSPATPSGTTFESDILVLEEVVDGLIVVREVFTIPILSESITNFLGKWADGCTSDWHNGKHGIYLYNVWENTMVFNR
jgi:hypothetical protein